MFAAKCFALLMPWAESIQEAEMAPSYFISIFKAMDAHHLISSCSCKAYWWPRCRQACDIPLTPIGCEDRGEAKHTDKWFPEYRLSVTNWVWHISQRQKIKSQMKMSVMPKKGAITMFKGKKPDCWLWHRNTQNLSNKTKGFFWNFIIQKRSQWQLRNFSQNGKFWFISSLITVWSSILSCSFRLCRTKCIMKDWRDFRILHRAPDFLP